jgi:putative phosphoesterase
MQMRVAIISDIHANYIALEAVLADLRRDQFDQIVCLGDAIQGGPQPVKTAARLRELGCPIVMGNADYFLLTGKSKKALSEMYTAVRNWTVSQLSKSDLDFISSFQPTVKISLGERQLLCFHGSPTSFDDIIFPETPEDQVQSWLAPYKDFILTGGHTHLQQIRRLGDSFFFNPGSIGLAYGPRHVVEKSRLDAWAEYAILSADRVRVSLDFRRVPFDLNALLEVYRTSGRPHADEMIAQYTQ